MICLKKLVLPLLVLSTNAGFSQTGTYQLSYKGGSSCTIAIEQEGMQVAADIFAWWHTPSGTHGVFSGDGILKNNTCKLSGQDEGRDCRITLAFERVGLNVIFGDCMTYNLPEDFSGTFTKISGNVPGYYIVTADQSFFYRDADQKDRLKSYLIRGDKIRIDIENIRDGKWIYINYTHASGKTTSGYMLWSSIKKIDSSYSKQ